MKNSLGDSCATANTKVQKDGAHKSGSQWTIKDLIEAGYADAIEEKQIKNIEIEYIFVNERAGRMVKDVKVNFINNFQHVAIDVKIERVINKGPSEAKTTP